MVYYLISLTHCATPTDGERLVARFSSLPPSLIALRCTTYQILQNAWPASANGRRGMRARV